MNKFYWVREVPSNNKPEMDLKIVVCDIIEKTHNGKYWTYTLDVEGFKTTMSEPFMINIPIALSVECALMEYIMLNKDNRVMMNKAKKLLEKI